LRHDDEREGPYKHESASVVDASELLTGVPIFRLGRDAETARQAEEDAKACCKSDGGLDTKEESLMMGQYCDIW
jgi:hypothetical protein